MRGGLPQREPEMIERWNKINLWGKLRELSKDREKFILHDGPLHMQMVQFILVLL